MGAICVAWIGLTISLPPELFDRTVHPVNRRAFAIPFAVGRAPGLEGLSFYWSSDRGKTWTCFKTLTMKEVNGGVANVAFEAPRDGLYWFAVDGVRPAGEGGPMKLDKPALKVYVNPPITFKK